MPAANTRDPESDPAAFFGDELVRARKRAGIDTQEQLASELGFERTVVAKIETGERAPSAAIATALDTRFPEYHGLWNRLGKLARKAHGPVPRWFEEWLAAEHEALSLRYWQPLIVPGLLQTAGYARALALATQTDTSDETIEGLVAAKLARQEILLRPDPPDVTAVLDEAALHRLIGSSEVMRDQLVHLADVSERSYIALQVVPADNGANAGLGGAFNIASGAGASDVLHIDAVEGQTTDRVALTRKAGVAFGRIRRDALSQGQSRDLILRVAEEKWNKQTG